jgi:hypothetical protein
MFFGNCRSSRDTAESRTLADLEVDAVSVVGIITICSWNRQPSNPCSTKSPRSSSSVSLS